jgi:predicted aspartyl protease
MRKYVFPYGFRLSLKEKKIISFPAVTVSLIKRDSKEEFSFLVLIDSGAEVSLFTKSDSQLLGIPLDKGEKIEIGSASGDKFSAFLHPVILKIGKEVLKIKVAFSERDNVPRILGRNPAFSYFFIIFDNKNQNTIFIPRKDKSFAKLIYQ